MTILFVQNFAKLYTNGNVPKSITNFLKLGQHCNILNKPSRNGQILLKFCQGGEILSYLVTLITTNIVLRRLETYRCLPPTYTTCVYIPYLLSVFLFDPFPAFPDFSFTLVRLLCRRLIRNFLSTTLSTFNAEFCRKNDVSPHNVSSNEVSSNDV